MLIDECFINYNPMMNTMPSDCKHSNGAHKALFRHANGHDTPLNVITQICINGEKLLLNLLFNLIMHRWRRRFFDLSCDT